MFVVSLVLVVIYWSSFHGLMARILLSAALFMPGLIIGAAKYLAKEGKPEYTHILIASHSFMALIASALLALLIHLSVNYFPRLEICLFEYSDLMWLKFAIFFFALMNGIVFPFLFPYISYMALYGDVKKKVALAEQNIAEMHARNAEKLKEFCNKIP